MQRNKNHQMPNDMTYIPMFNVLGVLAILCVTKHIPLNLRKWKKSSFAFILIVELSTLVHILQTYIRFGTFFRYVFFTLDKTEIFQLEVAINHNDRYIKRQQVFKELVANSNLLFVSICELHNTN